jgi:hypothetical protein
VARRLTLGLSSVLVVLVGYSAEFPDPEEAAAWKAACYAMSMDCSKIVRPGVDYDPQVAANGNLGEYGGGRTVSLDSRLKTDPARAIVMAHEFVHYLQKVNGTYRWPTTHADSCRGEKQAFDLEPEMASLLGLSLEASRWDDMKKLYECAE